MRSAIFHKVIAVLLVSNSFQTLLDKGWYLQRFGPLAVSTAGECYLLIRPTGPVGAIP